MDQRVAETQWLSIIGIAHAAGGDVYRDFKKNVVHVIQKHNKYRKETAMRPLFYIYHLLKD